MTHVVVHVDRYDRAEWPAIEAQLAATPDLRLGHATPDGRVYELRSIR